MFLNRTSKIRRKGQTLNLTFILECFNNLYMLRTTSVRGAHWMIHWTPAGHGVSQQFNHGRPAVLVVLGAWVQTECALNNQQLCTGASIEPARQTTTHLWLWHPFKGVSVLRVKIQVESLYNLKGINIAVFVTSSDTETRFGIVQRRWSVSGCSTSKTFMTLGEKGPFILWVDLNLSHDVILKLCLGIWDLVWVVWEEGLLA